MNTLIAFAAAALTTSATLASAGPEPLYTIINSTIDSGGGVSTSADGVYTLRGVIGQHDADTLNGTPYVLYGGFLTPLELPAPCLGDTNGDQLVNLLDLNTILSVFGQSTNPGIGPDLTGDGLVGLDDLNLVLANFGFDCNG